MQEYISDYIYVIYARKKRPILQFILQTAADAGYRRFFHTTDILQCFCNFQCYKYMHFHVYVQKQENENFLC